MACLAGMFLCCCAEGRWLCSFTFLSSALFDIRRTFGRALLGVYFLTRASLLRCRVVALDINASVNALVIHVLFSPLVILFFTTLLMRHFLLSVVFCGIWDLGCPLCTLNVVRILSRVAFLFLNDKLFSLKIGRQSARVEGWKWACLDWRTRGGPNVTKA